MGDVGVMVLIMMVLLSVSSLFLGWINYKINKLKEDNKLNIETIGSIITLEKAMKKLNEALKIHEHRLDHQRDDIYGIQIRLDILESGHPDSDIDYATLDDHDEVVEVWFNGKKYVPEDKRDENTSTLYADNKVVAETTKPEEKRCCATCQHYRPGSDHTCTIRPWLYVTSNGATIADSACNNYEEAQTADEVEYICFNRIYRDMGGNAKAKCLDELQKLNVLAHLGGCTAQELRQRWEELMRNDS